MNGGKNKGGKNRGGGDGAEKTREVRRASVTIHRVARKQHTEWHTNSMRVKDSDGCEARRESVCVCEREEREI